MAKAPVVIVSPSLATSNNGNWRTATRWRRLLSPEVPIVIMQRWDGQSASAMIALHARRSADSITRFRAAHLHRPLAVVLTGTDVYGDIGFDQVAQQSMRCASHLVVLQDKALEQLDEANQKKARVIFQSATCVLRDHTTSCTFDFMAVGHLRVEKDPLTLMRSVRLFGANDGVRIVHIGAALDPELEREARRTACECNHYRWLGALAPSLTRRRLARARALVHMSRVEGGANAVVEAIRSNVPVLASRIDGNIGLLGHDYDGYFPVGDAAALARIMRQFLNEPAWAKHLAAQCASREFLFTSEREADALRALVKDMFKDRPRPKFYGGDQPSNEK